MTVQQLALDMLPYPSFHHTTGQLSYTPVVVSMSTSSDSSDNSKKRKRIQEKKGGTKRTKLAGQMKLFKDKGDTRGPKRRHPPGEKPPSSRETLDWCKAGFRVDTTKDEQTGQTTSIVAICKLCGMAGEFKDFKVLNPKAKSQTDATMYKSSGSWSGPARHLIGVHHVHDAPELSKALLAGPKGGRQMRFNGPGTLDMHLTTWTPGGGEWHRAVRAVAQYAALSNSPFHIGETAPFVNFMRQFLPSWPFIGRDAIVRSVSQQCAGVRRELKELFQQVQKETRLAMTTDIWSSRAADSYLTATVHWIDDEWRLRKKILGG